MCPSDALKQELRAPVFPWLLFDNVKKNRFHIFDGQILLMVYCETCVVEDLCRTARYGIDDVFSI